MFRNLPRPLHLLALVLVLLSVGAPASAQGLPREDVIDVPAIGEGLWVSNLFQSNMVLQRDKPIAVWGWAEPGEKVTVSLGGKKASATAGKDRSWKVKLDAMPVSHDPQTMTIAGKDKTIKLENILLGDVWVLGGQSNMEFPLSNIENGQLEIDSANFPEIRIITVPVANGTEKTAAFPRLMEWSDWSSRHFRKGYWDVCTPDNVRELSAIGYVFARRLEMATQVPIGVIDASRGGTTVETWTPDATLRKIDAKPVTDMMAKWDADIAAWDAKADLANRIEQHKKYIENMTKQGKDIPANRKDAPTDLRPGPIGNHNMPSACYNGMIAPLAGLSVKGAIFHQGYNNCFDGTAGANMYRAVFPEMIRAWRSAFGDADMPFGILSLCTAGDVQTRDNYTQMMFDAGPYIRDAQYQSFLDFYKAGDKNIGFVSTFDLNRRWYHPQLKVPAGERIARWALSSQYGFSRLDWKPPMIKDMKVDGDKIILSFDTNVAAVDDGSGIQGFAIAGKDRRFHPADAAYLETGKDDRGRPQYDRKTLVLTSMMVPEPVAYRYAWGRSPMGNLQVERNSDIPFATHRSDDWPMENIPLGVLGGDDSGDFTRADRGKIKNELMREDIRRRYIEAQQFIEQNKDKIDSTGTN